MLESSLVSLGVQQPHEPLPRWLVLLEAWHDECRRCRNAGRLQEEPPMAAKLWPARRRSHWSPMGT